jgi:hypothetical protein
MLDSFLLPFTASLTSLVLSQVPTSQIHALPSGLFPSLEKLVVHIDPDGYGRWAPFLQGPVATFADAPALQRVAINKCFSNSESEIVGFRLPWHQLTHFVVSDYEEDTHPFLVDVLPQCVALQWLGIGLLYELGIPTLPGLGTNQPVTVIQNLRCLSLSFEDTDDTFSSIFYPHFFDSLKFPGLRSLRLEGAKMDFEKWNRLDPDHVPRFIDKIHNEFRLEYLSLCLDRVHRATLEQLLDATPQVTTLDAHIDLNYEGLFETLTIGRDSSHRLLPRLETLVLELGSSAAIRAGEGETIDPVAFATFLESRMCSDPDHRLRKIVLYARHSDEDKIPFVQEIQRYLPEGLLLERRVVKEPRYGHGVERDPELQDWSEAYAGRW